jgi:hypothetical protein
LIEEKKRPAKEGKFEQWATAVKCLFALNDRYHGSSTRSVAAMYLSYTRRGCLVWRLDWAHCMMMAGVAAVNPAELPRESGSLRLGACELAW